MDNAMVETASFCLVYFYYLCKDSVKFKSIKKKLLKNDKKWGCYCFIKVRFNFGKELENAVIR